MELELQECDTKSAIPSIRQPLFSIQWHLTTKCLNNCRHCYMERNDCILSLEKCKRIVDDFKSVIEKWDCRGRILFTGGDPLLYPYFFELLDYTRKSSPDLTIGILGNPELLTEKILDKLIDARLNTYQLSIDGLEQTHDYFRYPGSFKITIEKIGLLRQRRIRTVVMTTVSNVNLQEIPLIVDLVVENKVDLFGFHRIVPIGNGSEMKDDPISSSDYRELLEKVDKRCDELKDYGTKFGGGEPLLRPFHFEKGMLPKQDLKNRDLIWGGCSIGCSGVSILEDGTVLACRRLVIPIGKVPEQSIRDIFLFSSQLNKMRDINRLEKCRDCELFFYCRGCRAIAYATYGDYFKPDPQCWRKTS